MLKKLFFKVADAPFGDFQNKTDIISAIKDVQLCKNTVTQQCEGFSLQVDESTDMVDVAQLCVFVRMVFGEICTKEGLLTLLPLKGHT